MSVDYSSLDVLIDEYLLHDRNARPLLGFPSRASGTSGFKPNRTMESADELLEADVTSLRLSAMAGAWESLTVPQEQALRADAMNRSAGAVVWLVPRLNRAQTADAIQDGKSVLLILLRRRNILV